jgi:hypothetical protein
MRAGSAAGCAAEIAGRANPAYDGCVGVGAEGCCGPWTDAPLSMMNACAGDFG